MNALKFSDSSTTKNMIGIPVILINFLTEIQLKSIFIVRYGFTDLDLKLKAILI
jgi:hypothetical protein